jgi:2-keto-3-deoxy-L-fuconate dehydrogenase
MVGTVLVPECVILMPDAGQLLGLGHKSALITGAGSGIGQAIAETFAARGAYVHVLDIDPGKARNTVDRITASGGKAAAHVCDASDDSAIAEVVKRIVADGHIHILVNSVGIAHVGTLESTSPQDLDLIFRVNVRSYYNSMRAAIGHMKVNGGGVILNIASIAASAGLRDRFAYSMSKGAVVAMTYSVAKDYLEYKIRCNCISPARVHTLFVDGFLHQNYPGREPEVYDILARSQPIGRMAQPHEIASLALFLCSEEASFITGCDYPIDGGFFNLRG